MEKPQEAQHNPHAAARQPKEQRHLRDAIRGSRERWDRMIATMGNEWPTSGRETRISLSPLSPLWFNVGPRAP